MPNLISAATSLLQETAINPADTAWMLVACAMVLLMTPALAFFYGGTVRSRNALNTMMMSFASLGVVVVVWVCAGYSLAFAPGSDWLVGDVSYSLVTSAWKPTAPSPICFLPCFRARLPSSRRL